MTKRQGFTTYFLKLFVIVLIDVHVMYMYVLQSLYARGRGHVRTCTTWGEYKVHYSNGCGNVITREGIPLAPLGDKEGYNSRTKTLVVDIRSSWLTFRQKLCETRPEHNMTSASSILKMFLVINSHVCGLHIYQASNTIVWDSSFKRK